VFICLTTITSSALPKIFLQTFAQVSPKSLVVGRHRLVRSFGVEGTLEFSLVVPSSLAIGRERERHTHTHRFSFEEEFGGVDWG
jgi:hypothetical protein